MPLIVDEYNLKQISLPSREQKYSMSDNVYYVNLFRSITDPRRIYR